MRVELMGIKALTFSTYRYGLITCKLTWKNNSLSAGTQVFVIFLLADYDKQEVITFIKDNIAYVYGSINVVTVPGIGQSTTSNIESYAMVLGTHDIIGVVATGGPVGIVTYRHTALLPTRTIGLNLNDVNTKVQFLAARWFLDALRVTA